MSTNYWGPLCWRMLHTISYSSSRIINKESQNDYYKFFVTVLPEIIPCEKCRIHWKENISNPKYLPRVQNRNSMINWLINVHNFINTNHKKPTFTRREVDKIYLHKNHTQEVYRFLLYIRKLVQYKQIDQQYYNLCLVFVTKYLKISCKIS
jgi:hypothetical protein